MAESVIDNFIQFASTEADATASSSSSSRSTKRGKKETPKPKDPPSSASKVPDSVQERFIHIGENFYFPGGTEAFRREKNGLTTRSENAIVIQSMVAIARAESESGKVTVGGTDFFRKEAWFAASLVGLEVQGYTPTDFERERLVRALAARRGEPPHAEPTADRTQERPDGALITGRLVDHGPAHYQHNPKEPMSYFVRIETERGDREIWGVDLERAFRQSLSNPGLGDEVGVRVLGKEFVKVLAAKRDSAGREIGREELDTHKNHWSVERKDFLDQRRDMASVLRDASISAEDGIKRYAGLAGAYRHLESGEDYAQGEYRSTLHRQQFMEHLRSHLAKGIEYGQPLEPARPLEVQERTPSREPERDYHPTR